MSKHTQSNLFMFSPFASKYAGFYQDFIRGISSYKQLGDLLIQQAEQAHAFRQFGMLEEIGRILFSFPLIQYSSIGTYFLGVALNSCGQGDQAQAKKMFELVVDTAPDKYKVKAMLSLAAVAGNTRAYDSALYLYNETIKAAPLDSTSIPAIRTIAIIKGMAGDHHTAVKDLEKFYPLIRYAAPHVYFDYLNSLAVELGEVGRREEARNIMRVVLASPYASAYPEWRETAEELRPSRRSFVAAGVAHANVLALPERETGDSPSEQPGPARVFDLAKWKKQIAKQNRDKKIEKEIGNMSGQDMLFKLLELITENRPNHTQMRALLDFALSLFSQPSERDPDGPAS